MSLFSVAAADLVALCLMHVTMVCLKFRVVGCCGVARGITGHTTGRARKCVHVHEQGMGGKGAERDIIPAYLSIYTFRPYIVSKRNQQSAASLVGRSLQVPPCTWLHEWSLEGHRIPHSTSSCKIHSKILQPVTPASQTSSQQGKSWVGPSCSTGLGGTGF